ncbi:MAG: protein-glutamate O-methyltransferase CheR [Acidobacteria bacterium]|nr:MAG: protein-glutamate O-methyltransferase CheR [Acidobacteriota bacterium]
MLPEKPELTQADFDFVRSLVKQHSSISLDDTKGYLVSSRLLPLARSGGFESVAKLITRLRSRPHGTIHALVLEAVATTETSFFRDFHPYEILRDQVLPDLIRQRRKTTRMLNIWCGACSSGQEPYSVAMVLRQVIPDIDTWTIQLLASDFSGAMVERARKGVFKQLEVNRGLPAHLLVRYFEQHGASWWVKDEVKRMVTFFQQNLDREWTSVPQVDLLFLRNVLIYFDVETRRRILRKVRRHLRPDGFLIMGAAETTLSLDDSFKRVQFGRAAFYQPGEGSGP